MSWKSFVTAGLLCVLATPAFAVPAFQIVPGGTHANNRLNANGDYVWKIQVAITNTTTAQGAAGGVGVDVDNGGPLTPGSPLGIEMGALLTGNALLDANNLQPSVFDTDTNPQTPGGNPGLRIFDWENFSDTDGDSTIETNGDDEPVGLQSNCAGGLCTENTPGSTPNSVFAALGSADISNTAWQDFLEIVVAGPSTTGGLSTTIATRGRYGAGTDQPVIAELNDAFNPANPSGPGNLYSITHILANQNASFTAKAGDANLDNSVDFVDLGVWQTNFASGNAWQQGDFNGDNSVDFVDLGIWQANFGTGAGGGGTVPEPASMALVGLGMLMVGGLRFRKR